MFVVFFFKQKTAYEMRISDWSSDVCSSDLIVAAVGTRGCRERPQCRQAKRSRVYQVLRCPACVGGGSCRDFHGRYFPGMWRGTSTRLHFHQRRISKTRLKGVSAACRKRVKPTFLKLEIGRAHD